MEGSREAEEDKKLDNEPREVLFLWSGIWTGSQSVLIFFFFINRFIIIKVFLFSITYRVSII